jgi:biotin carboxyl carrier protein
MPSRARLRVTVDAVPLIIQPDADDIAKFSAAGRGEHVAALRRSAQERADEVRRFEVVVDGWLFDVTTEPARRAELRERVASQAAEHHSTARLTLRAQIPGRVVRLWVEAGESVERGQRLLAIEAMKMENEIRAPQPGVVGEINVEVGQRVEREDELLSIG